MNQSTLDLAPHATEQADRTGFEIGWDHAHHGLVPAPELLAQHPALSQGWRAAKAVFGRRTLTGSRHVRHWLQLRTQAWQQGIEFETTQVTPHYLAQIEPAQCPITREALGGLPGSPTAPVVVRLQSQAGYAAGHLVTMSMRAAQARGAHAATDLLPLARRIEAGIEEPLPGLSVDECSRLATLVSFATPLPFAEAARIPLRVLPPNRVRVLNAVQGLQALVTAQFASPGWSQRMRQMAAMLATQPLRHDFNLFVGAMAPRLLERANDAAATRRALEDAWADARVNRRWQQFVLHLGEAATEALLQRAAEAGLAAVRTLLHAPAQATEGWALATRGLVQRPAPRPRALAPA